MQKQKAKAKPSARELQRRQAQSKDAVHKNNVAHNHSGLLYCAICESKRR